MFCVLMQVALYARTGEAERLAQAEAYLQKKNSALAMAMNEAVQAVPDLHQVLIAWDCPEFVSCEWCTPLNPCL